MIFGATGGLGFRGLAAGFALGDEDGDAAAEAAGDAEAAAEAAGAADAVADADAAGAPDAAADAAPDAAAGAAASADAAGAALAALGLRAGSAVTIVGGDVSIGGPTSAPAGSPLCTVPAFSSFDFDHFGAANAITAMSATSPSPTSAIVSSRRFGAAFGSRLERGASAVTAASRAASVATAAGSLLLPFGPPPLFFAAPGPLFRPASLNRRASPDAELACDACDEEEDGPEDVETEGEEGVARGGAELVARNAPDAPEFR